METQATVVILQIFSRIKPKINLLLWDLMGVLSRVPDVPPRTTGQRDHIWTSTASADHRLAMI